jgi:hypothetical protein
MDQLVGQGFSHPLTGPQPTLHIPAKIARRVIRGGTSKKDKEYWQSIHRQKQARAFLRPSTKRAEELLNWSRSQLYTMVGC